VVKKTVFDPYHCAPQAPFFYPALHFFVAKFAVRRWPLSALPDRCAVSFWSLFSVSPFLFYLTPPRSRPLFVTHNHSGGSFHPAFPISRLFDPVCTPPPRDSIWFRFSSSNCPGPLHTPLLFSDGHGYPAHTFSRPI